MNKSYEKKLLAAFMKAGKNEKLLRDFLGEMLTDKEYAEVVRRFEVLTRLAYGEPQRTIAENLHLGIATVTRGSHVMTKSGSAFRKLTGKTK